MKAGILCDPCQASLPRNTRALFMMMGSLGGRSAGTSVRPGRLQMVTTGSSDIAASTRDGSGRRTRGIQLLRFLSRPGPVLCRGRSKSVVMSVPGAWGRGSFPGWKEGELEIQGVAGLEAWAWHQGLAPGPEMPSWGTECLHLLGQVRVYGGGEGGGRRWRRPVMQWC